MDSVFDLLVIILLGLSSISAFMVVVSLLLPTPIIKIQNVLDKRPGRSLLLGFVNFAFFGLLATLSGWAADQLSGVLEAIFTVFAGVIVLGLIIFSILGLVALAQLIGTRIDPDAKPFLISLRGAVILLLAAFAPFIGWYLMTPLLVWAGLGAAIQALLQRKS